MVYSGKGSGANISSVGSMGYLSDDKNNKKSIDSAEGLQDIGPGQKGSAGGIEDLKNWLKYESNKKYEQSCQKLSLDNQKI